MAVDFALVWSIAEKLILAGVGAVAARVWERKPRVVGAQWRVQSMLRCLIEILPADDTLAARSSEWDFGTVPMAARVSSYRSFSRSESGLDRPVMALTIDCCGTQDTSAF